MSTQELPELFDSDDGETWWIPGHHDDETAITALRKADAQRLETGGFAWLDDDVRDHELCVTRGWWRDAVDPADDERWERCDETDDGAEPFTRIEL